MSEKAAMNDNERCFPLFHRWRRVSRGIGFPLPAQLTLKKCGRCGWYRQVNDYGYGSVVYNFPPNALEMAREVEA